MNMPFAVKPNVFSDEEITLNPLWSAMKCKNYCILQTLWLSHHQPGQISKICKYCAPAYLAASGAGTGLAVASPLRN